MNIYVLHFRSHLCLLMCGEKILGGKFWCLLYQDHILILPAPEGVVALERGHGGSSGSNMRNEMRQTNVFIIYKYPTKSQSKHMYLTRGSYGWHKTVTVGLYETKSQI